MLLPAVTAEHPRPSQKTRKAGPPTRNDFLGEVWGPTALGEGETYSGELGESRILGIVRRVGPLRLRSGQALRGLNRISGFAGTTEVAPFPRLASLEVAVAVSRTGVGML